MLRVMCPHLLSVGGSPLRLTPDCGHIAKQVNAPGGYAEAQWRG